MTTTDDRNGDTRYNTSPYMYKDNVLVLDVRMRYRVQYSKNKKRTRKKDDGRLRARASHVFLELANSLLYEYCTVQIYFLIQGNTK